MPEKTPEKIIDVLGVGNAIVDILAYKDVTFLDAQGLPHGSMALVDAKRAQELYTEMGASTDCSGGSAANTLAGFAMLGGKASFIGKVRDDKFGRLFVHDMEATGVKVLTSMATEGDPTAYCLIMVTEEPSAVEGVRPRVERTMATYLGAAGAIAKEDVDAQAIGQARILYFEGYLWDSPSARDALLYAMECAKAQETKVAFTLSDALCVERHKADFLQLLSDGKIDILFANEHEIEALFEERDIRKVLYRISGAQAEYQLEVAVVTRSEKGSYILQNGAVHAVDAKQVEVYDVTGAGDLYASGFLYGYAQGFSPERCGELATLCATEVIQYIGARPVTGLKDVLKSN